MSGERGSGGAEGAGGSGPHVPEPHVPGPHVPGPHVPGPHGGGRSPSPPSPLSMQDRLRRRRSGGFVGRQPELAVFRGNLDSDPADPAHHFLFHVNGPGGVGKSTLLAQWERAARDRGALTATVGEGAMTVPAAMAEISARLAEQGRPLKAFDRRLAVYEQRRQEAEALAAGTDPQPSTASAVAAQAGLAGLGLLPGVGALAGVLDPGHLAQGVDRLRALLSARFRDEQDVRLVLEPVAALSPVFTADLAAAAGHAPWLALFFDTYERTGQVLGGWLRALFVEARYGALPDTVVVTLAGQGDLDPAVWADLADLVTPVPLAPFTEAEARQLLAAKGVRDEAVVTAVLDLTDGLPVLVSTLAATRPGGPEAVIDPADTAVELFLKWVRDPAGRAAAQAASLPLHLDEDVYRVAVAEDAPDAADGYDWLRGLPFVTERAGQARYHGVVRAQMLRLRRTRAPQRWREQHVNLAAAYGRWRERTEGGRGVGELWADGTWRTYRMHEVYHLLCADHRAALPDALLDLARACTAGPETARRWIRMLADAADDADADAVGEWARALGEVYGEAYGAACTAVRGDAPPQLLPGPRAQHGADASGPTAEGGLATRAVTVILERGALDRDRRALAHAMRAWAHRQAGDPRAAIADYERAEHLGLRLFALYAGRGDTYWQAQDYAAAATAYARALATDPDDPRARYVRVQLGGVLMLLDRAFEALVQLDTAIAEGTDHPAATDYRVVALFMLGRAGTALAELDGRIARATAPDPAGLLLRAITHLRLGSPARAEADLAALAADHPASVGEWMQVARDMGLALPATPLPRDDHRATRPRLAE